MRSVNPAKKIKRKKKKTQRSTDCKDFYGIQARKII